MASDTRMVTIDMTISSSMRVKPPRRLPLGIGGSIRRLVGTLGVHVEDILAAPTHGLGIVLHAALAPIGGISHRIYRDAPQKPDFLIHLARELHAFDQDIEA